MNQLLASLLAQTTTDLPPVAPPGGSFWMPPAASTGAGHTDTVFYFIFGVSAFFFALIIVLMVYFVLRYRQRVAGELPTGVASHNTALEITWSAIPLVLVIAMFYMGFRGFMDMLNAPAGAEDLRVLGQKWSWFFTYPNGHTDSELHVPVNRPVRLTLESADVIHSLYIPAFRIKRDAVPGRYNKIWFQAKQPGDYLLLCAEYCGTNHSNMLARVVVHPPGDYEKWLATASDLFRTMTSAQVGERIVKQRCTSCHLLDGRLGQSNAPSLKGIYEQPVTLQNGATVSADDDYIRESILQPQAKIVAGAQPVMPTFKGLLKDREITAIIDYIKELSGVKSADAPPAGAAPATAPAPPASQPAAGQVNS
jgi:cytochrome c oxidase subunit II